MKPSKSRLVIVLPKRKSSTFFSLPDGPGSVEPLGALLAESFDEAAGTDGPFRVDNVNETSLLQYLLPVFVVVLQNAATVGVTVESRRKVALQRLLYSPARTSARLKRNPR